MVVLQPCKQLSANTEQEIHLTLWRRPQWFPGQLCKHESQSVDLLPQIWSCTNDFGNLLSLHIITVYQVDALAWVNDSSSVCPWSYITHSSTMIVPGAGGRLECQLWHPTKTEECHTALKNARRVFVGKFWITINLHKDSLAATKHSHIILVRESFSAPELNI